MDTAVYLYALVQSERRPSRARLPAPLPETGPLRLVEAGDGLWLVVSDAPLARYGEAAIEKGLKDLDWVSACAVAHEGVVRHFARRLTTVPMRLFTLFRTDERAQEHVRRSARQLSRVLSRVDGCEEWGVRLFAAPSPTRPMRTGTTRPDSGRSFLERKRAQQHDTQESLRGASRAALSVIRDLARAARDDRKLDVPADAAAKSRLLVDAAFLVRRDARDRFRAALSKASSLGRTRGLRLDVTGPWPPYNFVDAK